MTVPTCTHFIPGQPASHLPLPSVYRLHNRILILT